MKRNEMKYMLAGLLSTMYETNKHPEIQLEKADAILRFLEKEGMQPPNIKCYDSMGHLWNTSPGWENEE